MSSTRLSASFSVKVLHSFYRSSQPSGENETVQQQIDLLASQGINVELIFMRSDEIEAAPIRKMLVASALMTGFPAAAPPKEWFKDTDVVHIHNTFPAMSHTWLMQLDIPKVITMHNYRAFCANGLFLRDGTRCMDCVEHSSARAVLHGCYRSSRIKSIPSVVQQNSARSLTALMGCCHQVLLPGEPMQEVFLELGVRNTQVLPNPVMTQPSRPNTSTSRSDWLYVGRISPEKGLVDLLRMWPVTENLTVAGDGTETHLAQSVAIERGLSVNFLGHQDRENVQELMAHSRGLIFTSKALEGAPLVYGEAMQAGLPIVAAEGSTLATQAATDQTGATFSWEDPASLLGALDSVHRNRQDMARRAMETYADRYTPDAWVDRITKIYESAISSHQKGRKPWA